ncbi:MAG: primosomal protein DnaI [Bacilli bacterium]|nr:primosomal protein DnaI [Bacilli bacterium]
MKNKKDMFDVDLTKLTHSFQDACADKDFKDFVYGLNIKEEILIKYTSSLQDAFLECNNCKNCKGLSTCKNKITGYKYTPVYEGNIISFTYDECSKEKKRRENNSYKDNLGLYELPKELKEACFKDLYKDDKARVPIIKYFKEFIDNYKKEDKPKGIYLNGSFGSGKTYLIAALFNEMAKKGEKSILVYYPKLLRNLKASFGIDYDEQYELVERAPLLLLDDIGAENCSNWSRDEVLGPILQYRMENHLPTFFTSNLTLSELEKSLSITSSGVDKVKARRIIERIKQLTVQLELVSKNRRD